MPAGYVIAQIDVTDAEAYRDYVAAVTPIVAEFGGEYLVRGGEAEFHEGTPSGGAGSRDPLSQLAGSARLVSQ